MLVRSCGLTLCIQLLFSFLWIDLQCWQDLESVQPSIHWTEEDHQTRDFPLLPQWISLADASLALSECDLDIDQCPWRWFNWWGTWSCVHHSLSYMWDLVSSSLLAFFKLFINMMKLRMLFKFIEHDLCSPQRVVRECLLSNVFIAAFLCALTWCWLRGWLQSFLYHGICLELKVRMTCGMYIFCALRLLENCIFTIESRALHWFLTI